MPALGVTRLRARELTLQLAHEPYTRMKAGYKSLTRCFFCRLRNLLCAHLHIYPAPLDVVTGLDPPVIVSWTFASLPQRVIVKRLRSNPRAHVLLGGRVNRARNEGRS